MRKPILSVLVVLSLLMAPIGAFGQTPTIPVTLAWDHSGGADSFHLERRQGQTGTYAPVALSIPGTARTVQDQAPRGQVFCYRLRAGLLEFRSPYSNEVCGAVLDAPVSLRIQ